MMYNLKKLRMVECLSNLPFRKLSYEKYLMIEVMIYVEHIKVKQFIFSVNKEARSFLLKNFIPIRNSVINEGLITYYFDIEKENQLNHYRKLEELYF